MLNFFYSSNISRQDDLGNHSFFEHQQYFLFPSFSYFGLRYTGFSIDIPLAEIQMNNKYIVMKNNMPRMTGLN